MGFRMIFIFGVTFLIRFLFCFDSIQYLIWLPVARSQTKSNELNKFQITYECHYINAKGQDKWQKNIACGAFLLVD